VDEQAEAFPRGFVILLILLLAGCYLLATWVATREYLMPWAWWCGFGVLALLIAVLFGVLYYFLGKQDSFLGKRVAAFLRATAQNTRAWEKAGHNYHEMALLFTLAGVVLFLILANVPLLASPVPIACFLLFVLLAVYGLLVHVAYKSLPIILVGVAVLALLGGLNLYKFRFPGMGYRGPIPGVTQDQFHDIAEEELDWIRRQYRDPLALQDWKQRLQEYPLDLKLWSAVDYTRQEAFDAAVKAKQDDAQLKVLKDGFRRNRVLPGKDIRPGVPMESGKGNPGWLLGVGDIHFLGEKKVPKPLVVVAVSGGGLRSAAWTLRVLQELELAFAKENPPIDFPSHVRLITGASGGMLGAAYYVATLKPPGERKFDPESIAQRRGEMEEHYNRLTEDCLTPIAWQMVFGDVPIFFSPWPAPYDRGKALENTWHRNLSPDRSGNNSPLQITFAELRTREMANECPSLVFTPMMIEDGRRLLISNLDLRYVVSNDGNLLGGPDPQVEDASRNYSHEALELFRLFPQFKETVKLSTAVRMSASFPFFSPAVSLPTAPRRRIVDAGYYDNYGVSLAASWLFSRKHQDWLEDNASKVVLIQIRDGLDDDKRRLEWVPRETSTQISRTLEELTSPLEGLDNARIGSSSFRNDGLLELLSAYHRERTTGQESPGPWQNRRFTTVSLEFPYKVSLSWYLTPFEKRLIARSVQSSQPEEIPEEITQYREGDYFVSFTRFPNRVDNLIEWWKAPVRRSR
jgi:hypothetical protein